jgi:hypothetical protein
MKKAGIFPSAASDSNRIDQVSPYMVFSSSLHGDGLKALYNIPSGSVLFREKPLHHLQSLPNKQDVLVCSACLSFLSPIELQIQYLTKTLSRYDIMQLCSCSGDQQSSMSMVGCVNECGEIYCSAKCRDHHWYRSHNLLCTGIISEAEAGTHPLVAFKQHAVQSNEIFLLCADIFAEACNKIQVDQQKGTSLHESIYNHLSLYQKYVRNLWWEAAVAPPGTNPKILVKSLKRMVQESWVYLSQTLRLKDRQLEQTLSEECLSRTIGMFEQNNVGIRLENPIANRVNSLSDHNDTIAYYRDLVATIASQLNCKMYADANTWSIDTIIFAAGEEDCEDDDEFDNGKVEDNENEDDANEDEVAEETTASATAASTNISELSALLELIDEEGGMDRIFPPLDGTAFYQWICKINHSCNPNVIVKYTMSTGEGLLAEVTALRDVVEGEELLQSYIDQSQCKQHVWQSIKQLVPDLYVCTYS